MNHDCGYYDQGAGCTFCEPELLDQNVTAEEQGDD